MTQVGSQTLAQARHQARARRRDEDHEEDWLSGLRRSLAGGIHAHEAARRWLGGLEPEQRADAWMWLTRSVPGLARQAVSVRGAEGSADYGATSSASGTSPAMGLTSPLVRPGPDLEWQRHATPAGLEQDAALAPARRATPSDAAVASPLAGARSSAAVGVGTGGGRHLGAVSGGASSGALGGGAQVAMGPGVHAWDVFRARPVLGAHAGAGRGAFGAALFRGRRPVGALDEGEEALVAKAVSGPEVPLPHKDALRRAFQGPGAGAIERLRAYVGGPASQALAALDVEAVTVGDRVAFRQWPSLETAAHEAAHALQVELRGAPGGRQAPWELEAEAVGEAVASGAARDWSAAWGIAADVDADVDVNAGVNADRARVAVAAMNGATERLPYLETIQGAFGRHDVRGVATTKAPEAADVLDAEAFAVRGKVGFADEPDLFTAAHEAAHVVQQRAGRGAQSERFGPRGLDAEQHADAVAERVVSGESAEALLDTATSGKPVAGGGIEDALPQRQSNKTKKKLRKKLQAKKVKKKSDKRAKAVKKTAKKNNQKKSQKQSKNRKIRTTGKRRKGGASTNNPAGGGKKNAAGMTKEGAKATKKKKSDKTDDPWFSKAKKVAKTWAKAEGWKDKEATAADEKNGKAIHTHKNAVGHDFTPESLKNWVKEENKKLAALTGTWQKHMAGLFPDNLAPNKFEIKFEIKVGDVGAATERKHIDAEGGGTKKATVLSDDSVVSASVKIDATLGWEMLLSELFKKSADDKWNEFSWDNELLSGTGKFDAKLFLGVEGSFTAKVGLGDVVKPYIERFISVFGPRAGQVAESKADEEGRKVQDKAKKQTGKGGLPKVATSASGQPAEKEKQGSFFDAGVEGSIFAGVKASVGVEAAAKWKKKAPSSYVDALDDGLALINPALGASYNLITKWDRSFAEQIAKVALGDKGPVDLLTGKAELSGTAGASLKGKFDLKLGKTVKIEVAGEATFGLGAGLATELTVDAVELLRFILAEGGGLLNDFLAPLSDAIAEIGGDIGMAIERFWNSAVEFLFADDKMRETVRNRGHETMGTDARAQAINTLLDGFAGDDDENAILKILSWSITKGDAAAVLKKVGIEKLNAKINGAEWKKFGSVTKDLHKATGVWFTARINKKRLPNPSRKPAPFVSTKNRVLVYFEDFDDAYKAAEVKWGGRDVGGSKWEYWAVVRKKSRADDVRLDTSGEWLLGLFDNVGSAFNEKSGSAKIRMWKE